MGPIFFGIILLILLIGALFSFAEAFGGDGNDRGVDIGYGIACLVMAGFIIIATITSI